ncbi:SMC family ATPase [uncultured Methanofollis sp.]|uniref:AAA family ATPase n=1 Tax=uncultured Methanofollis sp. TaxID=262500 RepID=UPI0026192BB1|nr:SMC family ATPase [uncultured Methanofollis sp.]
MLLHRLVLHNFKRYRDEEILFRDGITGIVGNNGAGKSTITDAVLFALYGVQGGVDGEYVVSSFADPKEKCEVRLEFSVGGEEYVVHRTFRKTGSSTQHTASLFMDGGEKHLADGVSAVAAEVRRVLGMGPQDFRSTVFAAQKDLLALLDERPAARREWFMKALGIDYLKDEGQAALKEEIESVEADIGRAGGALSILDEEELKNAREMCRADAAAARAGVKTCTEALLSLSAEKDVAEAEFGVLDAAGHEAVRLDEARTSAARERERYAVEVSGLEKDIADIRARLGEYDTLAAAEEEYPAVLKACEEWGRKKQSHDLLSERLSSLDGERRREADRLDTLACTLRGLDAALARCRDLAPVAARREEVIRARDACAADEMRHRDLADRVRTAVQHLDALGRAMAGLGREVEALRKKEAECADLALDLAGYDDLLHENEALDQAGVHAREALRLRDEVETTEREAASLQERVAALKNEVSAAGDPAADLKAAGEKRDDLTRARAAFETKKKVCTDEVASLRAHLADVAALGPDSLCPTCHRSLGEHYEALVADLERDAVAGEKEVCSLDEEITRIDNDLAAVQGEVREIEGRRRVLQEILARTSAQEERCAEKKRRVVALRECLDAEERAAGTYDPAHHAEVVRRLKALSHLKENYDRLSGEVAALPAKARDLETLDAEAATALVAAEVARADCEAFAYDPAKKATLEEESKRLEPVWQEYLALKAKCEGRPRVEAEHQEVSNTLARIDRSIADSTAEREKIGFDEAECARAVVVREAAEEKHRRYLACAGDVARLPDLEKSLGSARAALADADARRAAIECTIKALAFDPNRLVEVRERVARTVAAVQDKQAEIAKLQTDLAHLLEKEKDIGGKLGQVREIRDRVAVLEGERENLKLTRSLLSEYTAYLLGVVRGQLEGVVGEVLGEITDGRYDTVSFDDTFTLLVNDMGADYPADRFSGGEQDDIAIALRIALSRYLAGMRGMHDPAVLIFDEIFGSQDEERRANLVRALRTQEAHFPQIFLISHVGEVQDEFETTLRVEIGPGPESHVEEADR